VNNVCLIDSAVNAVNNVCLIDSAINAESSEANKVRNVVTGEIGAVPAVARFYKVYT